MARRSSRAAPAAIGPRSLAFSATFRCEGSIDRSRRAVVRGFAGAAAAALATPALARDGVEVGDASLFARLVPAEQVERAAALQYAHTIDAARQRGIRAKDDHPQLLRLRSIARRIIPYASAWNPRAGRWRWEVNLIGSPQVNAFCMPGGKIAFYWGILDKLQLVDDEVAMIMGHEAAHALRDHAREQLGKRFATRVAVEVGGALFHWRTAGRLLADMGEFMATLHFSRKDELEADLVGLELAARAGYDPRAGISLW
ncbi:MAG: M48 family metallopeptidase, partial [Pseudomonadota bacterium]|nr:M48 family metallopeptidase [Pseudomonadota bacterium]